MILSGHIYTDLFIASTIMVVHTHTMRSPAQCLGHCGEHTSASGLEGGAITPERRLSQQDGQFRKLL